MDFIYSIFHVQNSSRRAYAQDEVFEIIDSDKWECGKGARKCLVQWFPEGRGKYLLRSLPRGKVPGAPFIPGSREAIESAVRSITNIFDNIKYPGQSTKYNEWLSKMPRNDNVHDHISLNGLFVPFEKRLFGDDINRLINDPNDQLIDAPMDAFDCAKLIPTVRTTDCVLWSGRDGDEGKASNYAREDIETGLPALDCKPNAASRRAMGRKRKREQVSKIKDGDKIFINLSAWPEYEDEWPYASPKETTYVVGVYGKTVVKRGQHLRKMRVPVFEFNYEVDDEWIQDYGLVYDLPIQGKP